MANIHSLTKSITELSKEEATQLILKIRNERREAINKKKTKKKKSKSKTTKKKSAKSLVGDLSPEQAQELLKILGKDDE